MVLTPGTRLGPYAYISPEQVAGKSLDARSDVFSFGLVLHELLAGTPAFAGDSTAQVLSAVLLHSRHRSPCSPLIDAAMSGHATYREDLPLVMNRKGYDEHTWFTFSYSPVRDETGHVAGMFCAVSETTEKVAAERALRESEGRLRAFVAASSYALYRMSPDWSQMLALDGQGTRTKKRPPAPASVRT